MIYKISFVLILFVNSIFELFIKENKINTSQDIIINKGMRLDQISTLLHDNEIINNKNLFKLWVKIHFSEKNIMFGEYRFENKLSIDSVFKKISKGETLLRKLTIIEGWSKFDLYSKVKSLYPETNLKLDEMPTFIVADTYLFNVMEGSEKLIENIKKKSADTADALWKKRLMDSPLSNINEMFTLSSIVEKETSINEERHKIAGVFYNRINKGMRLQSDPTVVYALTQGKSKLERKLLRKDLRFKSKFNTYMNRGLPPEPICYPGLDSLKAVIFPEKNNLFFFVADPKNNGHIFSKDYDQHLKNIKNIKNFKKQNFYD